MHSVATVNPVNHVLTTVRQGFIGSVSWSDTWLGLVTLVGLLILFGGLAVRQMTRVGR